MAEKNLIIIEKRIKNCCLYLFSNTVKLCEFFNIHSNFNESLFEKSNF